MPNVLDLSIAEIAKRSGITPMTLGRYMRSDTQIPVQALIQLCNTFRISSCYFLTNDKKHTIPVREEAIRLPSEWKDIAWDTEQVEKVFGDGHGQINWKEVARIMDLTEQKPHHRFRLSTKFPVPEFILVCNSLSISPYMFIVDENRQLSGDSSGEGEKEILEDRRFRQMSRQIEELRSELHETRQQLAALSDGMSRLRSAYKFLASEIDPCSDNVCKVAEEKQGPSLTRGPKK